MRKLLGVVAALALVFVGVQPASAAPLVTYAAHVQDIGWQAPVSDGGTAGTVGQGKRMEALRFSTTTQTARAHVQNVGWQAYQTGAVTIGTTGQSLRMEAVQIGSTVGGQEIRCQAHVQDIGWMLEVGNNQVCGTTGQSKRLEAIRLRVVYTTPDTVLSKIATVGDIGTETAGLNTLSGMGATDANLVMLLGDLAYTSGQAFCDAVAQRINEPLGWVQGNHEAVDAVPGTTTADLLKCLPATPNATGTPAVEQIISIPGARIITASPQLGTSYAPGSAGYNRIASAIDSAHNAGLWAILAMHEPHVSVGLHGSSGPDSQVLSELAIAKHVGLVLTAHDHNYSRANVGGTTFIVAGMGGHNPRDLNYSSPWWKDTLSAYYGAFPGWVNLTIGQKTIKGQVSGSNGDAFTITR